MEASNIILIISISVSLVLSIISIVLTRREKKANIYSKLIKKYIIEKMPATLNKISFDGTKEDERNIDEAIIVIEECQKQIVFFKTFDKKFYMIFDKSLSDIVDAIIDYSNKNNITEAEKIKAIIDIEKQFKLICKMAMKKIL